MNLCTETSSPPHRPNLLRRNPDRSIQRDAGAGKQRCEQVALVAFGIGEVAAGFYRAAAFSGEDEGEIFPAVFVAVLKTGAPHHDAVVEQRPFAFAQGGHLFHHVGKLIDVELVIAATLSTFSLPLLWWVVEWWVSR